MFYEPSHRQDQTGWIEVISGSMFSGKTEELIRRLKRARIAGLRVEIFKPIVDNRYHEKDIVSHDASSVASVPVVTSAEILPASAQADVVGIDEAQFFDEGLISVCEALAEQGKRVIIAGLDMDYLGRPFGPMPSLMAIAEYVTKVHAICMQCSSHAHYSYRRHEAEEQLLLGEKDHYEPRCRKCFMEGMKGRGKTGNAG